MKMEYSVEKPLNSEPNVEALVENFITAQDGYNRNNGPVPHINSEEHVVKIDGLVHHPLNLSIHDMRTRYPQHEVISALQCAGNRRHTMRTRIKEVKGIDWGDGAVMNCSWRGAKLKDILDEARPTIGHGHVAFACYQTAVERADWFGGSITLDRALREDADILVALEMNGRPLTPKHGFPVRMMIPGVAGCRSIKWLDRITVQKEESTNEYQRCDYKILPPEATDMEIAKKFWDSTPALQDMPVNSAIASPPTGTTVTLSPKGTVLVKGYALPSGDQGPIVHVEVSADGGHTWREAQIVHGGQKASKWAWSLWEVEMKMDKGSNGQLLSRATDKGGNTQPSSPVWNLRGVCYNGYGEARDLTLV